MLNIVKTETGWDVDWDGVLDLTLDSESAKNVIEKLHELYESVSDAFIDELVFRAEMRGALALVEDGLTCGYILEPAETLLRVYDLFQPKLPKKQ